MKNSVRELIDYTTYTRSVIGKLRVTVRDVAVLEMYEGYDVCLNTACGLRVTTILCGSCIK